MDESELWEPMQGTLMYACLDLHKPHKGIQEMMADCQAQLMLTQLNQTTYFSSVGKCAPDEGPFSIECNSNNQITIEDPKGQYKFWLYLNPYQSYPIRLHRNYKFGSKECSVYDLYDYYKSSSQNNYPITSRITTKCKICQAIHQTKQNPFVHLCKCKEYCHLECIRENIRRSELCIVGKKNIKRFRLRDVYCPKCKDLITFQAKRDNIKFPIIDYKSIFNEKDLCYTESNSGPQAFQPFSNFVVLKSKATQPNGCMFSELIVMNIKCNDEIQIGSGESCNVVLKADKISESNTIISSQRQQISMVDKNSEYGTYMQIQQNQNLYFRGGKGLLIEYYHLPTYRKGISKSKYLWLRPDNEQITYSFIIKGNKQEQSIKSKPSLLSIDWFWVQETVFPIPYIKRKMQFQKKFIPLAQLQYIPSSEQKKLQWIQRRFVLDPNQDRVFMKNNSRNYNFWVSLNQGAGKIMRKGDIFKIAQKPFTVYDIYDECEMNKFDKKVDVMNCPVQGSCSLRVDPTQTQQNPLVRYCNCLNGGVYAHLHCLRTDVQKYLNVLTTPKGKYIKFRYGCRKCKQQISLQTQRNSFIYNIINYRRIFFKQDPKSSLNKKDPIPKYPEHEQSIKSKFIVLKSEGLDSNNRLMTQLFIVNLINSGQILIGEDSKCDISIQNETLNKIHSKIWIINGQFCLFDNMSQHGTYFLLNSHNEADFDDIDGVFVECESRELHIKVFAWIRPQQRTLKGELPTDYKLAMKYQ